MSKSALFLLAALAFTATVGVQAATPPPKKKVVTSVRPKAHAVAMARTTPARTVAKRVGTASARVATRTPVRGRYVATRSRAPIAPPGPSPDRYKEIQQALATKGYYNGDISGQWSSDSADALKRFQNDQNLRPDGKLSSVSLIALGLGPKRNTSAQVNPAQQPTPAPAAPPATADPSSTQPSGPQSGARN